jgi:1-acyl-sn-glycerol-3-phosphate acyltransferase
MRREAVAMGEADASRRPWFYEFTDHTVRLLLTLFCRWRVIGAERMPMSGPLLLVSNHMNNADPAILIGALPRMVRFLAKDELFRFPVGLLMLGLASIKLRRGKSDREAIRTALSLLEQGVCVGIFPEGTRSRTGGLIQAQTGAGLLALRSNAPIVPVVLIGTRQLRNPISLLKRPKIDIIIGEPFSFPQWQGGGRAAAAREATDLIMRKIAELLPTEMRGVYSKPSVAAERGGPEHP